MNSKAGVAAVDRAFDILHAFRHDKPVLTLAEISRITGLYKSTILRLMGSLEKYGFVWQRADGSYQLGAGLLALSTVFQDAFDLRQFIDPVLDDLVAQTAEGASFFIRDGEYQVCLFRAEGRHTVRDYSIRQGDRRELNRSAASTILRDYEAMPYAPLTPDNACVISIGSVDPEMAAVGVPVFGAGHKLMGAITLSGPSARFTDDYVEKLRPIAIDAAARLSINLGETPARFAQVRAG
ncbi:IclR family transcriptional regulator [Novosphingobium sp. NBM11]|uniref:IclR family transcriptional regulator n=1 Tax=unclassified Novosphingobium TaxID=2644732 RepID=UPI00061BB6D6|nr:MULTISPECIES: IclR family transcriptional regulator [unclassified Novosphingobium]MBF5088798.1 IclR family transcriptional regulator [Novosphingobium sp. NBM11]GAO56423.1 transcriptional regulator of iclR family [Novosphingobium sp. MD-1]